MVAPPGVNEAALPEIDVGSPGRIAIAYYATTRSPGGPPFPGEMSCAATNPVAYLTCPPNPAYAGVPWQGYLTVTSDALAKDPVFYSGPVNDPSRPLERGACGPIRCQAGYDFLGVSIAPDGVAWAVYVDGSAGQTLGEAVVARLVGGPSLVR
jgi:hypothetical protein